MIFVGSRSDLGVNFETSHASKKSTSISEDTVIITVFTFFNATQFLVGKKSWISSKIQIRIRGSLHGNNFGYGPGSPTPVGDNRKIEKGTSVKESQLVISTNKKNGFQEKQKLISTSILFTLKFKIQLQMS